MAIEHLQTATPATTPRPGRWLFRLGWLLLLLGLVIFGIQFFALKKYVVPWYAPILATIAALAMLVATVQRWSVLRIIGLGLCLLLTAVEWLFVLGTGAPPYAGPGAGQMIPAFSAIRADGSPFSERDLAGQPTVLLFFRGHW